MWTPFPGGSLARTELAKKGKWTLRVKKTEVPVRVRKRKQKRKWTSRWFTAKKKEGKDGEALIERELRDKGGFLIDKKFFTVKEKLGVDGRHYWMEVIPMGESTDEEGYGVREGLMREERFYHDIERQMAEGSTGFTDPMRVVLSYGPYDDEKG